MKTKAIIILTFIVSFSSWAQSSCCSASSATALFASMTNDKNFVNAHLEPIPFVLVEQLGKDLNLYVDGGIDAHVYEIKNSIVTNSYVFVIHEWWGLNDYIKQESEKIFKTLGNVNVIAIDLYDNKVATNRDSAASFMQSVKTERAEAIVKSVISHIGLKASVATIGWCFGGGWSMQAALLCGKQAKACVMYYGMPEEKVEKLKTLNAPVLFVWPESDQWINKEVVDNFAKNMRLTKINLQIINYKADHAFANPSNPKFNKVFADDAFEKSMNFIKTNLK